MTSKNDIPIEATEMLSFLFEGLLQKELIQEISKVAHYKEAPPGTVLMTIGDYLKNFPILIEGTIKILREDEDGNELLLYYLEGGDTCAMSLTCCMNQQKSEIRAVVEQTAKLFLIPSAYMDQWFGEYPSWKRFVFASHRQRFDELLETIDTIAFKKMDDRLLKYLRDKALAIKNHVIPYSHQEIAYDMNTSRVVISRLLKQLEKSGMIKLYRNQVEVLEL